MFATGLPGIAYATTPVPAISSSPSPASSAPPAKSADSPAARVAQAAGPSGTACGTLRPAGFGALAADQVTRGEIPASGSDCYTVTAPAGLKRVRTTGDGCAPAAGTAWDQRAVKASATPVLGAVCRPFTAAPGERVVACASNAGAWITDATGADICAGQEPDQDGCVLPGQGPYRMQGAGREEADPGGGGKRQGTAPIGSRPSPALFSATE